MRLVLALSLIATPVLAQDRIPSHCIALAAGEARVMPAALEEGLEADTVLIRYIDHASFAVVTPDGTVAVTDYTGYLGTLDLVPDVVTMNNAHSTHWTALPDPRIPHVLRGWGEGGTPADHRLDLGAMLVLVSAMQHGVNRVRLGKLHELFGVSRWTVCRWRGWWLEVFGETRFWKEHRGRLHMSPDPQTLPLSLLEYFFGAGLIDRLLALLRFLSPLSEPGS